MFFRCTILFSGAKTGTEPEVCPTKKSVEPWYNRRFAPARKARTRGEPEVRRTTRKAQPEVRLPVLGAPRFCPVRVRFEEPKLQQQGTCNLRFFPVLKKRFSGVSDVRNRICYSVAGNRGDLHLDGGPNWEGHCRTSCEKVVRGT